MSHPPAKTEDWNIRKFPLELKRKCQGRAKEEKKTDPRWLAEVLCTALGFPRETYIDPIYRINSAVDSAHESRKEELRRDPGQTDTNLARKGSEVRPELKPRKRRKSISLA